MIRKVLIYRPVLTEMSEIRKGDFFRMVPAAADDDVGTEIMLAAKDAAPCSVPGASHEVEISFRMVHRDDQILEEARKNCTGGYTGVR